MATPAAVINLRYRKRGTCPPVFVAGTFTNPPWEPLEMEYTSDEDGEHTFLKTYEVNSKTEVQYKFRIGYGNWWVVCEDSPTTTDSSGYVNNVLKPKTNPVAECEGQGLVEDGVDPRQAEAIVEDPLRHSVVEGVQGPLEDSLPRSPEKGCKEGVFDDFRDELVVSGGSAGPDDSPGSENRGREEPGPEPPTPGNTRDGCFESLEKYKGHETDEGGSATGTEQSEEIRPPAPALAIAEPEIVTPDEGVSLPQHESRVEVPVTKSGLDDPVLGTVERSPAGAQFESADPSDSAVECLKAPTKLEVNSETEGGLPCCGVDHDKPKSSSSSVSPESNDPIATERSKINTEPTFSASVESSSNSATKGTAVTRSDMASAADGCGLRERFTTHRESSDDSASDSTAVEEKDMPAAEGWWWSFVAWFNNLLQRLFGPSTTLVDTS